MNEVIRVRVKDTDDIPAGTWAATYKGRVIEVSQHEFSPDHYVIHAPQMGLIDKKHTEPEYGEAQDTKFRPESGMVFVTVGGHRGFFMAVGPKLWCMLYGDDGRTVAHTEFQDYMLTSDGDYAMARIFRGMLQFGHYALSSYISQSTDENELAEKVWERPPAPRKYTVKLNDRHTATIQDGKVRVGCQDFPLEAIKEVVRLAEGGDDGKENSNDDQV